MPTETEIAFESQVPTSLRRRMTGGRETSARVTERPLRLRTQILLQLCCLGITFTVIFPILWIFGALSGPRESGAR